MAIFLLYDRIVGRFLTIKLHILTPLRQFAIILPMITNVCCHI